MRWRIIICFYAIVLLIAACSNGGNKQQASSKITGDSSSFENAVKTGLSIEPSLQQADSLQILYYDNPDGDSLRYTRFFKYTITKDPTTINDLIGDLSKPVEQRSEIKKCRSEGKIYVFGKQTEEPLKTIYFSTRCDTCCYLYYIKEGAFYYSPLSINFKNKLKENKALSRTP
ncbi:MAG TPA: hypothetical protein VF008_16410 [Niastella sp.]